MRTATAATKAAASSDGLNAPYGLALVGGATYVASQDALVRFSYREGQTQADGAPTKVANLLSAIDHNWTKALAASPERRFLNAGIGSNSNSTERWANAKIDRAMVWEIGTRTGTRRPFATGLRNPTALTFHRERAGSGRPGTSGTRSDPTTSPITPPPFAKAASTVGYTANGARRWTRAAR